MIPKIIYALRLSALRENHAHPCEDVNNIKEESGLRMSSYPKINPTTLPALRQASFQTFNQNHSPARTPADPISSGSEKTRPTCCASARPDIRNNVEIIGSKNSRTRPETRNYSNTNPIYMRALRFGISMGFLNRSSS